MNESKNEGGLPGISRFQAAVVILMFAAGALLYPRLPDRIPLHWDIRGQVDRWGARTFFNVFFPALIALGFCLLAWVLPRLDPLRRSYERFRTSYYLVLDVIVAFLAFLYGVTLYGAFNPALPVGVVVPIGVGLLMAVIGNQLGKIKRNFYIGIRTPWTLASETVWTRTHRIGGRLFVVAGLGCVPAAFLPAPMNFIVFLALVLGASLASGVISYVIYHRLESSGRLTDKFQEPERG